MIEVELRTRDGGMVTRVLVPVANPPWEAIVWGSRIFFRKGSVDAFFLREEAEPPVYVEGVAWFVPPG